MKSIICNFLICLIAIIPEISCIGLETNGEKVISRSFIVRPGGNLIVDTDQGDIQIVTADRNEVGVLVSRDIKNASESKMTSLLKANKITFSANDNKVHVQAFSAKKPSKPSAPHLIIHFCITVPRRFNVSLNTDAGSIEVADLNGTVDAHTSRGNLSFEKIQGALDAHTSEGAVHAENCSSRLALQTSAGNIVIKNFTGPNAQADTAAGSIEATGCGGKLQAATSSGNIILTAFSGPSVYANSSSGSISFDLAGQLTADSYFRSGAGGITVKMPANSALNLIATTDAGIVSSAIPVVGKSLPKEGSITGKINGGGPALVLRTGVGDIEITKQ